MKQVTGWSTAILHQDTPDPDGSLAPRVWVLEQPDLPTEESDSRKNKGHLSGV